MKVSDCLKELRVHHYIKNFLMFFPVFFNGNFFNISYTSLFLGFAAFSLASSFIYVINDISDIEKDRLHKTKSKRPIASGKISIHQGTVMITCLAIGCIGCLFAIFVFSGIQRGGKAAAVVISYCLLNFLYSYKKWKDIPLIDVCILSSGFLLRLFCGSILCDIEVSAWLYLVVLCGALYLGFGKRRNELLSEGDSTRKVLKLYSQRFLDQSMLSCMTLTIVFFSLWCLEKIQTSMNKNYLFLVPLLILIFFRYHYILEMTESEGDPVDVILKDRAIFCMAGVFVVMIFCILYF